ncbi:MAG: hypothetical protein DLD55_06065 [candidate division SR1 bacterium]|nr:MAG: hypothetical protein DLD55_06065 [candidate division SR1 bacterium]
MYPINLEKLRHRIFLKIESSLLRIGILKSITFNLELFSLPMQHKVYGCKVNKFYLNKRIAHLEATNQVHENLFLVATCVVTDRAKMKWVKEIIEQAKLGKQILIAGCGSITKGKATERSAFFTYYPELQPYQEQITLLAEDPLEEESELAFSFKMPGQKLWTKNYVIIQNGCDNHCSFCLTIFKRGPHRNRPLPEIIEEIKQIEAEGGKEIVLTGINLAAWGASNTRNAHESRLNELLEAILEQTSIPRIRISSLDPQYLDDRFFQIISNPRFCPHFHLSIQSFSPKVLKLMHRGYDAEQLNILLQKFRKLNRPDAEFVSLGADIICGFPGETEEDFQLTCEGVQEHRITKLHAFPFSDHHKAERIPASLLPDQVPNEIRKSRNRKLIEIGDQVRDVFVAQNYGRKLQVLIEETKKGKSKGWTENYIQVSLPGTYEKGSLVEVILDETNCVF